MNDDEKKLINELKDILSDVATDEYTDFDYLRWLQGHNNNMDVIVPLLRQHFLCIRSYDFDNYDLENAQVMEKYWPYGLMKSAGKGHNFPYIETSGTWDPDGVIKSVSKVDILLHRMYKSEQVLKALRTHEKKTGHQSHVTFIFDAEGTHVTAARLVSLFSGPYKNLLRILLEHYAELAKTIIVINAPKILLTLYNLVKPILPQKTGEKLIVLGSNWKTDILQYCDPDTLPVHYGGTLVDENNDTKCASQIIYCTKVPEELYWSPLKDDIKSEDLTVLTVAAGSVSFVIVEVTKENSFLEWYYNTDGDWGFGVFFTENKQESKLENMDMVFPKNDYYSGPTIVPERAKIKCKKCGFYKIWFNNYFSWFTKLNVRYKTNLIS